MGHGITETDKVGIVGSNGWHGLGKKLPEGMTAAEGFKHIGLGWTVELAPAYCEVVRIDEATGKPFTKRIELTGYRGHVRVDNDAPLGVVTEGYQQFTNRDLWELLDSLAGQDAASVLESGGSLFGGRRVFGCIKLPQVIRVGADIVETYMVGSNGHGGFAGLNIYPTSVRPECANMLRWSERDLGKGISLRHTGDLAAKVKQAKVAMGLAQEEVRKFEAQVQCLHAANLSVAQVKHFLEVAYADTFGDLPDPKDDPVLFEKARAKRDVLLKRWEELLSHPKMSLAGNGTAWQALNAVTYWHDHERGKMKEDSDQRLHSNLFGVSNRDKQVALAAALDVVVGKA